MSSIWVIAELKDGKLKNVTLELLGKSAELAASAGMTVEGVVLGAASAGIAKELADHGASRVLFSDNPALEPYNPESHAAALSSLINEHKPTIVLLGASILGKDLAPRISAQTGAGLATDCTDLTIEGGKLTVIRPVFAGKVLEKRTFNTEIQIASVRPNIFAVPEKTASDTTKLERVDIAVPASRLNIRKTELSSGKKVELTEARIIVSGGRGMKGPENFTLIEGLAEVLGAATGASRVAVDSKWRHESEQVGQTGKTVSPDLYIAVGISGAIQHLAGMGSSKCIVAINSDPEAPIFKVADYGVVGDLFKCVPLMIEEVKKVKA